MSDRGIDDQSGGLRFWLCAGAGSAIVGFGFAGLVRNLDDEQLGSWATFFLGALLAHDLVLAPAVALLGAVTARVLPRPMRAPLQAGFVLSAVVASIAIPVLGGWGRLPNNPSLLPGDYGHGLVLVLGAIWAATLALVAGRTVAAARRRRTARRSADTPAGRS